MEKCKATNNDGTKCQLRATLCGYCVKHFKFVSTKKRKSFIKKVDKKIGWVN